MSETRLIPLTAEEAHPDFGLAGSPPLCPCGCQLTVTPPDEAKLLLEHFDEEGRCRLCARPIVSSKLTGEPFITDRHGDEITCPLCLYTHIYGVLYRHAEALGDLRRALADRYEGAA